MLVTINEVIQLLEFVAPLQLQENYDNSGLIVGAANQEVSGILITIDCTEEIITEAINKNCNLIIAHHPVIFNGLKKINGYTYTERIIIKAIKHNIAIYAIHTNLDNVLTNGVNGKIAEKLGLTHTAVLEPRTGVLKKLVSFVPKNYIQAVEHAVFLAGAGHIGNYSECAFLTSGEGSFKAANNANPFVGSPGSRHYQEELRFETIFYSWQQTAIMHALLKAHPYEEVAYDIYSLSNTSNLIGAGIYGVLPEPTSAREFLKNLKNTMELEVIRYTKAPDKQIKKVALCGGSGSFLLNKAIGIQADVFITADFKYHQFFDAEDKLMICDIGHYESEKYTKALLNEIIVKKFSTFAVHLSETNTNPVNYYI